MIGEIVSTDHKTVLRDQKITLSELSDELQTDAVRHRALMNERYNRLFTTAWQRAQPVFDESTKTMREPNIAYMDRAISIMKSQRELNGLDLQEGWGKSMIPIILRVEEDDGVAENEPAGTSRPDQETAQ